MARLTGENIEQFSQRSGNNSSGSYFKLSKDGEVARVRFLYNSAEDIDGYAVHPVKIPGIDYERNVNCLRDKEDPIDKCPFCRAKLPLKAKVYIPLYNEDVGEFQVWERGSNMYGRLSSLCARYPNIVNRVFEIERNGAPGYQKTDYAFYPVGDSDGTTIEDILNDLDMTEIPSPVGTKIMDKSAEDMEYYLKNGEFPSTDSAPIRRRGSSSEDEAPRRRANRDVSSRGRGDRF